MRTVHISELKSLVGQEVGVSDWFTLDQDRINRFADVTEDHQWIHVDVERAQKEIGGTIAHGFLTLSMMSAMTYQILDIQGVSRGINYGFDKIRFTGMVRAGQRVRLREKVLEVEDKAGGFSIKRECTVEVEGSDRPALVAEWIGVVYP
jgi:acyl dehydratase